jgi:phage N-6-adenine-methyltransferase
MTAAHRIGNEPVQKPGRSKQDYGTPWPLIRAIEKRWGRLTIDLAATRHNSKAPKCITPEEDSLKQDWSERIGDGLGWLNPPFEDIDPWAKKCLLWYVSTNSSSARVIMLSPASIGSEWFADNCEGRPRTWELFAGGMK